MNATQQNYFTQVLQYLNSQTSPYKFCLDSNFYQQVLPNITLTKSDKLVIGREFAKQVKNNSQVSFNGVSVKVKFDYVFSNCPRCGYKDSSNKIHYIK